MRHTSYVPYLTALAALAWAPAALGDDSIKQCAAAHEAAQTRKMEGKYLAALEQARLCAQSSCGTIFMNECIGLYEELQRDVPTFVFAVQNGEGAELSEVNVIIDGQLVLSKLEGKGLPLDPGPHTFRFESEGLPSVEVNHIARLGDRNRLVTVTLGEKPSAEVTPAPETADSPSTATEGPPPPPPEKGIPTASYVLAGVGVLGLGAFTYLRVSGISDYNNLNTACSPRCDPTEVDDIRMKFTASYIALGIAGSAFAGAAVIYFSRGDSREATVQAGVVPLPGGGAARVMTRF